MATTEAFDSLPYIDADITQDERDKAQRTINKEIPRDSRGNDYPSLSALYQPRFSSLMQQELERCASEKPMKKGIDLSRYEAPDEPSAGSDISTYRDALKNVYTSSTYLASRRINLQLLEEFGKNAWLIGNAELEGLLKTLERELADVKEETEQVNRARKIAQEGSRGELLGLEDTWKKGIGKIIEVQVATDQLRTELNQRRRSAVK